MCETPMQDLNPDERYGRLRAASSVQEWEKEFSPLSTCELTEDVGEVLRLYIDVASHNILSHSARALLFIWMMDSECRIWIAVEEFSPHENPAIAGFPRLDEFTQKKLGHPSLRRGEQARIAGELFLDEGENGDLYWCFNVSSGRFCKEQPPNDSQQRAALERFHAVIDNRVRMDEEP